MDVDTDPFSFEHMRDQLDGIQQVNSNYEESKSSCSHHTPQHKVLKKKWKMPWFEAKIKTYWDSEFMSDVF